MDDPRDAAEVRQQELLGVDHDASFQPARLTFRHEERCYLEHWAQINKRVSYLNHGYSALEWILCPDRRSYPPPVSRRDAAVAASFAQWLGTSAGLGFLKTCEALISKETNWRGLLCGVTPRPEFAEQAEMLCGPVKGHPAHAQLVKDLGAALERAKHHRPVIDCGTEPSPRGVLLREHYYDDMKGE